MPFLSQGLCTNEAKNTFVLYCGAITANVYWWVWPFRKLPVTTGKSTPLLNLATIYEPPDIQWSIISRGVLQGHFPLVRVGTLIKVFWLWGVTQNTHVKLAVSPGVRWLQTWVRHQQREESFVYKLKCLLSETGQNHICRCQITVITINGKSSLYR